MPRAKKAAPKETQRFPIDDGAVVIIEFDPSKRPKMVYVNGVVIIGEHQCGPVAAPAPAFLPGLSTRPAPAAPLRNFEVEPDDPKYIAFKAKLAATTERTSLGQEPAPADFSPPVITNDIMGQAFVDRIKGEIGVDIGTMPDPAGLIAAAK